MILQLLRTVNEEDSTYIALYLLKSMISRYISLKESRGKLVRARARARGKCLEENCKARAEYTLGNVPRGFAFVRAQTKAERLRKKQPLMGENVPLIKTTAFHPLDIYRSGYPDPVRASFINIVPLSRPSLLLAFRD